MVRKKNNYVMNMAKVKKLMTPTEAKVLIDLIRHQNQPDKKIAEAHGMAASNFAVVKRHLEEKGVLQNIISINMTKIKEVQVVAFVWLKYNAPIRPEYKEELDTIRRNFPVACTFGSQDWSLNVDYFGSFEEAENARLALNAYLNKNMSKYLSEYVWKMMPISHLVSGVLETRLMDYTINHKIKSTVCSLGSKECGLPAKRSEMKNLTQTEKKVLVGLRRNPGMKKSQIAKKLGLQQSSFSEVYRGLCRKGIIDGIRIVDPRKLPRRKIATFAWMEFKQPMSEKKQKQLLAELLNLTPQAYRLYATRTFILLVSFNYSLEKAEETNLMMLEKFGDNLSRFNFKIVPTNSLTIDYTSYHIEKLFTTKKKSSK